QLVAMVRQAGAAEVHLRVSSPPYKWPCFYGMDTSDRSTLIASQMSEEEICRHLGADSLGYLSLRGLLLATGGEGFCTACLSGEYPTAVPVEISKYVLEGSR
ncbi:MAG TPA: amidophosphoribosyltransferase, partial [Acidimicrobiia bacterium]|nr:amidophosphoribosyltransferase [Acidimicrobiia bacterium]